MRIAVIGAGAAGTMAAIFAATGGAEVLLLERTRDGGRKILISGGGRCNVLPARVVEKKFGSARVEVLGAVLEVASVLAVEVGDEVRVALRPEAIEVVEIGHRHWTAKVTSRVFLGEKIEYLLRCADETLQVARYNAGASDLFHVGETVGLRFVEDAMIVLKHDDRDVRT